jgi:hypothetical protein
MLGLKVDWQRERGAGAPARRMRTHRSRSLIHSDTTTKPPEGATLTKARSTVAVRWLPVTVRWLLVTVSLWPQKGCHGQWMVIDRENRAVGD